MHLRPLHTSHIIESVLTNPHPVQVLHCDFVLCCSEISLIKLAPGLIIVAGGGTLERFAQAGSTISVLEEFNIILVIAFFSLFIRLVTLNNILLNMYLLKII
jgi:hypothetical protein